MIKYTEPQLFYENDEGEILPPQGNIEVSEDIPNGEYWDNQDDPTVNMYEVVDGQLMVNGETLINTEDLPDRSVSIQLGHQALRNAARIYALRARAKGLERAAQNPTIRAKLDVRMRAGVDSAVAGARANTELTFSDEKRMLEPAIGANKMRDEHGNFDAESELAALSAMVYVRSQIGVGAGQQKRNAFVKSLNSSRGIL